MSNTDFKISSTKMKAVVEDWRICFKYNFKKWEVTVSTHDGIVCGGPDDNVMADPEYFLFPDDVREKHFMAFKKAIIAQKAKQ